ncbi:MAG TPA: 23S rRNA (pseudouridine(1915)-N(3))-methyltransferase RlmH [Candidatus Cloacimonadota bacterium]|nr:23S rRNA (pseudouridine(1915)-N(3))-methyltransferase RlmH [Candidatus Cloacimonadota bacterium]
MNLRIIQLGKDKDAWLTEAIGEYRKRLSALCKLDILELPDVSIRQTGSSDIVVRKEADAILPRLDPDDYVILLDERGVQKTSLEFSAFLDSISDRKRIVFVIGGVYGTDERVRQRANVCLSLSPLTFTHRMVRLILTEQIYRALMIRSGRSYHV